MEEIRELGKSYFSLHRDVSSPPLEPKSFPLFKKPEICNLQVCSCIWKSSRNNLKSSWKILMESLVQKKQYNEKVGYDQNSNSLVFKLRRFNDEYKLICSPECSITHPTISNPEIINWKLENNLLENVFQ